MRALILSLFLFPTQGLVIKDLVPGKGQPVAKGDLVTVEYVGKLTNGKQFETSKGNPPFSFTVGAGLVIDGWDQGVVGMKVGGKRALTVPPSLAYGRAGAPPKIPANATLKYEIKLLHVWRKGVPPRIQMTQLKPGKPGRAAKRGDTVDVHYRGTFLNGHQFDSSIGKKPISTTLGAGGMIAGFDQGITGMKVGEKRRVVIPPSLGYGEQGRQGIPPNATLVFELTLVKFK